MYANQRYANEALFGDNDDYMQSVQEQIDQPAQEHIGTPPTPFDLPFDEPVARTSLDDHYCKLNHAYGLHIHRSKHIDNKLSSSDCNVEHQGELVDETIKSVKLLQTELTYRMSSANQQHSDKLRELKTRVDSVYEYVLMVQQTLQRQYSLVDQSEELKIYKPISSFHFDYRGLFLTIRYASDLLVKKLQTETLSKTSLEIKIRRTQVIEGLIQMATIILTDKETRLKNCTLDNQDIHFKRVVYYPFADGLCINEYNKHFADLDVQDYFTEVGNQYAPMLKLFLGLMVTVTASHTAVRRLEPTYKVPGFSTGLFLASNAYYFLNAKAAAKATAKFFNDNLSATAGKSLWTIQDTNPFLRFGTFLALPKIELSSTFTIPLEKSIESCNKEQMKQEIMRDETKAAMKKIQRESFCGVKLQEMIGESSQKELEFYLENIPKLLATVDQLPSTISLRLISSKPLTVSRKSTDRKKLRFDYPHIGKVHKLVRGRITRSTSALEDMEGNGLIFHIHGM
jgi:hypothetical protein